MICCSNGLWCRFDVKQKGDLKKEQKLFRKKKEPSRWFCCFRNAIYPQTMLAHLRFPLCRKQLTEYKKQSGVKGCLVACFIAEGRVRPFKVHSFVSENIFCKATTSWNVKHEAFCDFSVRYDAGKNKKQKSPTGSGIEAARTILFLSEKAGTVEPTSFCRRIFNLCGGGNYEIFFKL